MEMIAIFSPFVAFMLTGVFPKFFPKIFGEKGVQFVTCGAVILAAFASIALFFDININEKMADRSHIVLLGQWIKVADFSVQWSLMIDSLSVVMMCIVNIISACVHVYSIGYMHDDPSKSRFMSYLSFLTFAMLILVTAGNALQLLIGWESVGLAAYLLIGFWNQKHSANTAALKTFIINRTGDIGLILGIITLFLTFETLDFSRIFSHVDSHLHDTYSFLGFDVHALTLICLLLLIGAIAKSAQLDLHIWLPDTIEGPTPVSALIHSATMVTAGVFLVARFSPLFEYAPVALIVVTIIGATTAFVAGTIALTQFNIKRIIAYSTMSQLGYMFFALGVSAYSAAMFHLVTHAFFKALLFLAAGSIIHALSGEQDIRNMGGLRHKLPVSYAFMLIGSLALIGIWPFAGFFSSNIILEAAWSDHSWFGYYAYWLGICATFMTGFYICRLLFMVFYGNSRVNQNIAEHVHEAPFIMNAPLLVLSTGAILAGGMFYGGFVGSPVVSHHSEVDAVHSAKHSHEKTTLNTEDIHAALAEGVNTARAAMKEGGNAVIINAWSRPYFWHDSIFIRAENDTVEATHNNIPKEIKFLPLIVGLLGSSLAYVFYILRLNAPSIIAQKGKSLYVLFSNKWFFDAIYSLIFVRGILAIAHKFRSIDKDVIDYAGPNGVAGFSKRFAKTLSNFQNGYVHHYALVMIIALIALMSWFIFKADPSFYKPAVTIEEGL